MEPETELREVVEFGESREGGVGVGVPEVLRGEGGEGGEVEDVLENALLR